MKYIKVVICAGLLLINFYVRSQTGVCCPFAGWDYVVPITFTNQSGAAINNLQIPFFVNTVTPIAQGKMQADGRDIRFYINCGQYLNYWIESGINTANTKIWIRIPNVANNATITIYMNYGNPSAAAVSNQASLFPNIQTINGGNISGTVNADWINVNGNVTMTAGQIANLRARKIVFNATFNGDFLGYGPQAGPGAGINGNGGVGGSGGSYGGAGGSGGGGTPPTYGTPSGPDIDMGSGGGGSDCNATARGGGAISMIGCDVSVNGTINVRGQNDQFAAPGTRCCCGNNSEAAGGGSGGGVLIQGDYVSGSAAINANGGNGGNSDDKESGGGGGGGRVKIFYCKANDFSGNVNVQGGLRGPNFGQNGSQNGANGTFTQNQTNCYSITVNPEQPVSIPTASFTTSPVCLGTATTFTNTSTSAPVSTTLTSTWDFGDATNSTQSSPSKTYNTANTYNVSLTVTSSTGCTASTQQQVTVNPNPTADFNSTTVCENNPVNFTDASGGNPTQWNWNFGSGNTSTQQNPSFSFTGSGSFPVNLIVTNAQGCTNSITKNATVNPGVSANFTANDVCFGNTVQFNNTSSASTGSITGNFWLFGDGGNSTQQNPSRLYATAGTFNVSLIVQGSSGCTDTITKPVSVSPKPVADFSVADICFGNASAFTDASTVSSANINSWAWAFGDGNNSTLQNPQHNYATSGSFQTRLIVSTDGNCRDTITKTVNVFAKPVPNFNVGAVCLNNASVFSDASTISFGNIASWNWTFGDGGNASQQNPVHTYTAAGTFDVKLIVISNNNCTDSITKQVTVHPKPEAAFAVSEVCLNSATVFTNQSTISSGTIQSSAWTYGDGNDSTLQNPQHTYNSAGNFNVQLIVFSNNNCTDTATAIATVNPLPQVNFTAPDVCLGTTTSFTNQSSISSGAISVFNWNFGDGNTSQQNNPTHQFAASGNYNVSLEAVSDKSCTVLVSKNVRVFENPSVVIGSTPACFDQADGTATATAAGGTSPYSFMWSNGSSVATLAKVPAGNYAVTVTDANNCTATNTGVVAQPNEDLKIISDKEVYEIQIGEEANIQLSSNYSNVVFNLSPNSGLSCSDCANPVAAPLKSITYNVVATDAQGCKGEKEIPVLVQEEFPIYIPNFFSPNGDGSNDFFKVFTTGIKKFEMKIFNRWGEKIFETDDTETAWDGYFKGKPADPGNYVYEMKFTFLNGKTINRKGSLMLLR